MTYRSLPLVPLRWVRCAFVLLVVWGGVTVAPRAAHGQDDDPTARVDPATGGLALELATVLEDGGLRRALHSGLPIRIEVSIELWRDGFFDQQEAGGTWRASVLHDAVTQTYEFQIEDQEAISLPDLGRVAQELQAGFESEVRPRREGRYYYLAEVELQTLSLSDLEELGRWLQGDLAPVVEGEEAAETAVARGLRRVMVRALRLPARRERLRTPSFDWPPPGSGQDPPGSGSRPSAPPLLDTVLPPPVLPESGVPGQPATQPGEAGADPSTFDSSGLPCTGPANETTR